VQAAQAALRVPVALFNVLGILGLLPFIILGRPPAKAAWAAQVLSDRLAMLPQARLMRLAIMPLDLVRVAAAPCV
jgi:hypothetical protein